MGKGYIQESCSNTNHAWPMAWGGIHLFLSEPGILPGTHPVKLVPQSDLMIFTAPRTSQKRRKALMKDAVLSSSTTSICTARVVQVNRIAHRLLLAFHLEFVVHPGREWRSELQPSAGRSAIFCTCRPSNLWIMDEIRRLPPAIQNPADLTAPSEDGDLGA